MLCSQGIRGEANGEYLCLLKVIQACCSYHGNDDYHSYCVDMLGATNYNHSLWFLIQFSLVAPILQLMLVPLLHYGCTSLAAPDWYGYS